MAASRHSSLVFTLVSSWRERSGALFKVVPASPYHHSLIKMTQTPSSFKTKGTVSKVRLARYTEGQTQIAAELATDDPYVVGGVMSFSVDGSDNVEAVPEIGKRGVDYAPGTFTAQGTFVLFFQKEYNNKIVGDLMSLNFSSEGERFLAEVYYDTGYFLRVPILITNRSDAVNPQSVNQVSFNFVCTDVPDYRNLAIRNTVPDAPTLLEVSSAGITFKDFSENAGERNWVNMSFRAPAEGATPTSYELRYRNTGDDGLKGLWSTWGGTPLPAGFKTGNGRLRLNPQGNDDGSDMTELRVRAINAVGHSGPSNVLYIPGAPAMTVSANLKGAKGAVAVTYDPDLIPSGYSLSGFEGKESVAHTRVTTYGNAAAMVQSDFNAASRTATMTTAANLSATAAQETQVAIRAVFTNGEKSYWAFGTITAATA